jgi:pyridoxal phosphate enzyme (YggS family)
MMSNIATNILSLRKMLPGSVTIVAVSKMQHVAALREAYDAGQRVFGENKVQELVNKQGQLPADIAWHFIGHLQTNKVKMIVPFIDLIHSIDSLHLLREVDREAKKHNRKINCLLQIKIAREETKFGLSPEDAGVLLDNPEYVSLHHINIIGVMGMGSFSDDHEVVRKEFKRLHDCYENLKALYFKGHGSFDVISMGMSGDFMVAIEEGSTMVRIGTSIFGERQY